MTHEPEPAPSPRTDIELSRDLGLFSITMIGVVAFIACFMWFTRVALKGIHIQTTK